MQRDFKIGLISGLVVVIAAVIWLATRPSLSLGRLRRRRSPPARQSSDPPAVPPSNSPPITPTATGDPNPHDSNSNGITDWTIYQQPEKIKTQKFHIVARNQTLSDIADRYYGSATKWKKIYNANKDVIENPDSIRPGTKLIIPE